MNLVRVFLVSVLLTATAAADTPSQIHWQSWSPEAFQRAKAENKLVLLNLEAVWCHWCHVMDQETYADENVASFINQHYVAIKVDHDAQPDVANRYRDYGWPATIFLSPAGNDLVKRAGYIEKTAFLRLLNAVVADPTPEAAARPKFIARYASEPKLDPSLKQELIRRHLTVFDPELGGLRTNQKTLDRDHVEYALKQAYKGDAIALMSAQKTLEASFALVDPEWGGIYQYSTRGNWQNPHFEKIMASQAGFLRVYALAFQQLKEPRYLTQAVNIVRYLEAFLTAANGAFYTSQDADLVQGTKGTEYFALEDQARRKLGIPRIDMNIYARENGWAIEALAQLYEATKNPRHLSMATRAAKAINASHRLENGGYLHISEDDDADFLGDSLNMGAALLQLYKVTGERKWLLQAEQTAVFITDNFKGEQPGFLSGKLRSNIPVAPTRHLDENIKITRFLNLLAQYTGNPTLAMAADHGMRYLSTREVALQRIEESGILIAAEELSEAAPHYTIVGEKRSSTSGQLFDVGLGQPGWYKRIEWWDKTEGPLRNADVTYPSYDKPAGFVCVNRLCSAPSFDVSSFESVIQRIIGSD